MPVGFDAAHRGVLPLASAGPTGNNRAMATTRSTTAWAVFGVGTVTFLAALATFPFDGRPSDDTAALTEVLAFVAIGITGLILARKRPGNPAGWIYLGVWAAVGIFFALTDQYAALATIAYPRLPGGTFATWLTNWIWVPIFVTLLTYPFLYFPDGRLPSPRWRPVVWYTAAITVAWSVAFALEGHDYTDATGASAPNPYAIGRLTPFFDGAREVVALLFFVAMGMAVASLVVRFRRSRGDERQQIKWLMLSGALLLAWLMIPTIEHGNGGWPDAVQGVLIALIPASVGIAILKYRLYDVDLVIKKTVVFTVVVVVLTGLYLGVIAMTAVGTGVSRYVVGILLLAVTFNPVRRAAGVVADRVVYGRRASSYEVLAAFSGRMAETYATDDVLPRMAQVLCAATGASSATVWLQVGSELTPVAAAGDGSPASARELDVRPMADGTFAAEVRHQGELLGALSVAMPANDPLDPARSKLVRDLASQAGLVLRNVKLIEEVKASRQRLVAAQDEERRKIERNIHDGAQQQLVALSVQLKLAEQMVGRDPERERALLAQLGVQANEALEDLRDLARGIYPPLLQDKGLPAALEAQARKAVVPTTVAADGVGRFPQDVEAAIYFSCLEALQNVAKYARASRAEIALSNGDDALTFSVTDDGAGFDPASTGYGTGLQGIADRLAAIGGQLAVRSAPGAGTTVTGRIPAEAVR